jgi:hypothetical protein
MEPGIYPNLSNSDYHGDPGSYSKSSLVDFEEFPANLPFQRQNRIRKTVFDLGTAAHTAILEPEKFEDEIAVIPDELLGKNGAKSNKACKEWIAGQPSDKAVLTVKQRDSVLRVRDSVHDNPEHSVAHELLSGGQAEVSCFWNEQFKGDLVDDETGYHYMQNMAYDDPEGCHKVLFKARPDYIPKNLISVDLKTTKVSIDQESFEKQAYNLHYHWSAGMTLRGLTMATGKQHRIYIFVVVQTDPPYEVAVYRASEENIGLGKAEVMDVMQRLAYCDFKNYWPGMPNRIQTLGLPGWAYKKLNDQGGGF